MPIPASERKAWAVVFAEQFTSTPAPYFGVNIFDVLTVNWEPLLHNVRQQHEGIKQSGGRSHLWAVRDDGQRKRVLWINHFPHSLKERVDKDTILQFGEDPVWVEFCNLVESFQWFCATEQPSAEP